LSSSSEGQWPSIEIGEKAEEKKKQGEGAPKQEQRQNLL